MAKKKDPAPAEWLIFNVFGDETADYNLGLAELATLIPAVANRRGIFERTLMNVRHDCRPSRMAWSCYGITYGDFDYEADPEIDVQLDRDFLALAEKPVFAQKRTETDSIVLTAEGFYFTAVPKHDDSGTRLETRKMKWADWDAWLAGGKVDEIEGPNPAPQPKGK